MIWLVLAWCGVAVWLGLAIARLMRDNRRDNAVADKCRMQLHRAQREERHPRAQDGLHATGRVTDVHRLLSELDEVDPRLAKTATLCWIGGLSRPAVAARLGTSVDVVERDLYRARCMLWNGSVRTLPPGA
ncbi:MAG TPA: ECF-type sigma factor [Planctomycetota bacterium]|nr:ECF-type sigma factor [Planctomycetota bacterium]